MEDKARTHAPMRTCAVAARKGGVGKTFASISLAVNAAFGGPDKKLPQLKVLFICRLTTKLNILLFKTFRR